MQPKIALAIGGAALAIPSTALAAAAHDAPHSPVPGHEALRASGHMTRDAAAVRRIHTREHRRRRARHRRHDRHVAHRSTASAPLQAIAACESGGNPSANTGNGFYGKYQFTMGTWTSVGGRGNPAAASEAEQDRRAAMLYARAGSSPWPVCGR
jgi:hypothetical protein